MHIELRLKTDRHQMQVAKQSSLSYAQFQNGLSSMLARFTISSYIGFLDNLVIIELRAIVWFFEQMFTL